MSSPNLTPLENIAAAIDPTIWGLPSEFTTHRRQISLEKARAVLEVIKQEAGDFDDTGYDVADIQTEYIDQYNSSSYLANAEEVFNAIVDAMASYINKEPTASPQFQVEAA
ncbi:hypothetical protein [Pseudovibrio sp. POLY-S9]|uniref:hypothetical protein n=1 Tax=Pseudovibrio sp. POLY-S9 TaxID=1576596 RepID=UPI00070F8FB3|nr:hypothetical protein [Pseudovibrio sp. POLY-S9]